MSDTIEDLVEKYKNVSLPLRASFNSTTVRLDEVDSDYEQKYHNRAYFLKALNGKKGTLFLGDIPLSQIFIKEDGRVIKIIDKNAGDILQRAVLETRVKVAATVGRASIDRNSFTSGLKPGSLIALDRDFDNPGVLFISDNDYVIGQGEALTIDAEYSTFGFRLTSLDGGGTERNTDYRKTTGEVILGEITLPLEDITRIGEGTILDLGTSFLPVKMTFSDKSTVSGYLQYFLKEELASSESLINSIPELDNEMVLAFCVTSETGLEPDSAAFSGISPETVTPEVRLEAVLSVLDDNQINDLVLSLDYNTIAWILKKSCYKKSSEILSQICLELGEEKGAALLDSFIRCNPDKTPDYVVEAVCASLTEYLDSKNIVALKENNKESFEKTVSVEIAEASAARILKSVKDEELKKMLEWLKVWSPDTHKVLMQYL